MNNRLKLATSHLTWAGMTGLLWYISIFTVIYIAIFLIFGGAELDEMSYLSIGLNANRVFMLVMGIIVGGAYIAWTFSLSVTRKQFYKANLLSGLFITILLTGAILLLSLLVNLLPFVGTEPIDDSLDMHPVLNIITATLQTFMAYIAGALIGTGFYRNGWAGTLGIIITVIFFSVPGMVDPYIVDILNSSAGFGVLIVTILFTLILAMLHYVFTRDIVIKL